MMMFTWNRRKKLHECSFEIREVSRYWAETQEVCSYSSETREVSVFLSDAKKVDINQKAR